MNELDAPAESGTLFVVATPIGNLADITLRALDVLRSVALIAAEDTRRTRKLLTHYDIYKPLISYHSHNLRERTQELLKKLTVGTSVALVTDAGTPGISDPGALLVQQAIERSLPVAVIPGPTALISALVASGLPTHPFAFLGFPPAKGSSRRNFFSSHASLPMTRILYESPNRLGKTLEEMLHFWGDRRIAIARELTKHFEEFFRGTVVEAIQHFAQGTRGELTVVVEGFRGQQVETTSQQDWQEDLVSLLADPHVSLKQASEVIVLHHKLSRRVAYQKALEIRGRNSSSVLSHKPVTHDPSGHPEP
jgi:16S rRNA (cytidine1402-2'-O)-methyltransferase